jgi:hypothetical protein
LTQEAVVIVIVRLGCLAAAIAILSTAMSRSAEAVPFNTSYTDGSSWNSLYAQGFSPSQSPNPDPGLATDAIVPLDRFQFFKSGNVDSAMNFRLAIVENFFLNLQTFTTISPQLVGLSTNAVASTATIPTGQAITFSFDSLPLVYGNDYAAIFVTEGAEGALTPVLVATMLADYVETSPGSGTYVPESDYGDPETDYFKSASNFINANEFGSFLAAFNAPYGDASFIASFDLPPESIPGDYNNSGAVEGGDLTVWQGQFGQTGTLTADGDADNDVDGDDFLIWQRHLGQNSLGAAAVPEPDAVAFALMAAASIYRRGRKS